MKTFLLNLYYFLLQSKDYLIIKKDKILGCFYKQPVIMDTDQTIEKLLSSNCSMSRFGDGEFTIAEGGSIGFQAFDIRLQEKMKYILSSSSESHITCIPHTLITTEGLKEIPAKYWDNYFLKKRGRIIRFLNSSKTYYDTQVTRLYIDLKDGSKAKARFSKIKEIWKGKKILIIEGEKSKLGVGNDLFEGVTDIKRIICPATNAFSKYQEILESIKKNIDQSYLILIALGPTATVLAYDLYKMKYRALDIGHIDVEYEWMNMEAKEKVPLKNKFVGDIFTEGEHNEISIEYKNSIVDII